MQWIYCSGVVGGIRVVSWFSAVLFETFHTLGILYLKGFTVLLHNGGVCNGCITKRILLFQAFHSQENQYYADYDKKY
jgi:hypothetical protein